MKKNTKLMIGAAAVVTVLGAGLFLTKGTENPCGDHREELTMWGSWSGSQVDQLNEMLDMYNESQDDVCVTYTVQSDLEKKLVTAMAGGESPDVVLWDRVQTAIYAPTGALEPLDSYVEADGINMDEIFYPEAVDEMTYEGTLYGVPSMVDTRVLFYNKDMFDEAGLAYPTADWTWEDMYEAAVQLTQKDAEGNTTVAGLSLSDPGLFNMYMVQAGGEIVTDEGEVAFNSPEGMMVLDYWQQYMDAGVYQNGMFDEDSGVEKPFIEGKTAMTFDGPWAIADIETYAPDMNYGVVPAPAGPGGEGSIMGGFGLVIPSMSDQKDEAWEFIKWWTMDPAQGVEFAKISGWIPANMEAAQDPYFTEDPIYSVFVDAMDNAVTRPTVPGYADVEGKSLVPNLELWMEGSMTSEEALSDAEASSTQILEEAEAVAKEQEAAADGE